MDYLESIKIRAMASVMDPDNDAFLQTVFEWYSREYYTPLHIVKELPLDDVMYVYFRGIYRLLEPEDRHNEAIWLLETPEERKAREAAVKNDEEDFLRMAAEQNKKKKTGKIGKKVDDVLSKMRAKQEALVAQNEPPPPPPVEPQSEEVTVTYMTEAEFEAELDKAPNLPPRKKPT